MDIVSVVITTYNRADFLPRCVKSCLSSPFVGQVVIVDDHSKDDTPFVCSELEKLDHRIWYQRNSENRGHSLSRNIGARFACFSYILFLDDDNILDPLCIFNLLHFLKHNRQVGFVSPLAYNVDCSNSIWSRGQFFDPWLSIVRNSDCSLAFPIRSGIVSNAYMIRRSCFEKVKGFDPRFRIFEDADIQRRLGLPSYILPEAITHHYHSASSRSPLRRFGLETPRRSFWFMRDRLVFWRRHYTLWQWLFVSFVSAPMLTCLYSAFIVIRFRFDILASLWAGLFVGFWISAFDRSVLRYAKN